MPWLPTLAFCTWRSAYSRARSCHCLLRRHRLQYLHVMAYLSRKLITSRTLGLQFHRSGDIVRLIEPVFRAVLSTSLALWLLACIQLALICLVALIGCLCWMWLLHSRPACRVLTLLSCVVRSRPPLVVCFSTRMTSGFSLVGCLGAVVN